MSFVKSIAQLNNLNTLLALCNFPIDIGNLINKDKDFADSTIEEKFLAYPFILHKSRHQGKTRLRFVKYDFPSGCYRLPSVLKHERLMTIPDGYDSN